MNLNDFSRGGTAPTTGKIKAPFGQIPNIVRPKTRAVDNDFLDINIELRNNRPSLNAGNNNAGEKLERNDFMQEPQRRASSRGRSGRDGTSKKSGLPSGALSAYTQNMTNIVLNVSKKNQRTTSATGSPRVIKANLNQLNDLRTAYGAAALPISKNASPTRPKTGKSTGSGEDNNDFSRPSSQMRSLITDEPTEFYHDLVVEDEISPEGLYMPAPYQNDFHSSDMVHRNQERGTKIMVSSSPSGMDGSPIIGRRPSKKSLNSASPSKLIGKKTVETMADNFNRKMNIRDSPSPLSNYESTPDIEILGSSRSDVGGDLMFAVPDEILLKLPRNNNISPRTVGAITADVVPSQHRSDQQRQQPHSQPPLNLTNPLMTGEDDRLEDYLDYSDNDEIGESYDGSSSRGVSAKIAKLTMTAEQQANKKDDSEYIDSTLPSEDAGDSKDFVSVPARPQSRKLYLGSERGSRPTPTIKAPRSAGARYGAHSPLQGGEENGTTSNPEEVRKGAMKRLGSLDNIKAQIWEEEDHAKERPPSRQSSAFPVHLADDNVHATSGTSTSTTPTSASKNRNKSIKGTGSTPTRSMAVAAGLEPEFDSPSNLNKLSSGPSPQRSGGLLLGIDNSVSSSLSGSPGTIPIVPAIAPIIVTSSRVAANIPNDMDTMNPSKAMAVAPYMPPNTELRSIKKTRSGGANMAGDDEEGSVNSAYQKRPPSRQKVAAQHLFDNDSSAIQQTIQEAGGSRPLSTRGGSRSGFSANSTSNNAANAVSSNADSVTSSSTAANAAVKPPPLSASSARGSSARSQVNTARSLTTRSKMHYDPKDDGFGDFDSAGSSSPFMINVNYGLSSQNSIEVISMGDDIPPSRSNATTPMSQAPLSSPYRKPVNTSDRLLTDKVINGRSRVNTNNLNNVAMSALPTTAGSSRSSFPSPYSAPFEAPVLRPKSVTNGVVLANSKIAATSGTSSSGSSSSKKKYVSSHQAEAESMGQETLRSMSAGHGQHHNSDRNSNNSNSHNSNANNYSNSASSGPPTRAAFGDWSEPDPRLIPRAQNKFGLETDTGWTSPSFNDDLPHYSKSHQVPRAAFHVNSHSSPSDDDMLQDNNNDGRAEDYDYRPTSASANNVASSMYQDNDDMTIMTEDSGNEAMMMDQSLSMQSFPLESSLGEDFLSLFAPGGPN